MIWNRDASIGRKDLSPKDLLLKGLPQGLATERFADAELYYP
jgi:hypothetical protein